MNKNILEKSKIPLSLRLNFSWTLFGNLVYAGCQWGLLIILAKLGSPNEVGIFSLGLALTGPIYMLTNLQLRSVIATDSTNDHTFNDFLGLRLMSIVITILMVTCIVLVAGYNKVTTLVILVIGFAKGIEAISDITYGLLQKKERMDFISKSMILKGVLSLLAMGLTIFITGNLVNGVIALAMSWFLVLFLYDLRNIRHFANIRPTVNTNIYSSLIKTSLPLGIVMMLISLNANIPRYVIEYYLGADALGFYSAIAYIVIAGTTVVNALGQSSIPRLSRYFANFELKSAKKLIVKLLFIALAIGAFGILISIILGEHILKILYDSEYGRYSTEFTLVMVYAFFSYLSSFLGYSMTAARAFKIQPLLFVVSIVGNIIFSVLLTPMYGIKGAIYGLIISGILQFGGSIIINIYIFRRKNKIQEEISI
ncbi:oligosaccharide flippase family protein [Halobacillus kuroshimensis]|uniref:Oligosaccharide flippase family protein n=1 Tax=Halobacillus kuroshimensis TaxID=302481 RepID=A0ABS3DUX5_9BACI|nr:oligosaccharide flippase family protein [Halobacillus kuroshimensis]MBN8235140.1 oligosaccharide flippase family protein [Halobacillus kuroshimensis]